MTHPILRAQESAILSAPGKRTGNLEKKTNHSHPGWSQVRSGRHCKDSDSLLKDGELLESSEQRSNITLHFTGIILDDLLRIEQKGMSVIREAG